MRKGAEALNPFDYFRFRYYEKWLGGICGYFIANGYVLEEELERLTEIYLQDPHRRGPDVEDAAIDSRVTQYLVEGDSPRRTHAKAFEHTLAVGDALWCATYRASITHDCLDYLRNRFGVIESVYADAYVYLCDTGPDGVGPAMPVYSVRFDAGELWPGNTEDDSTTIYADLYAAYVAPAEKRKRADVGARAISD